MRAIRQPSTEGWPRAVALVATLIAILCVASVYLTDRYGISNDTRTYVGTAESLVAGTGYRAPDGHVPVEFAPLYPLLLAALFKAGISTAVALMLVNVGSLLLLSHVTWWSARHRLSDWWSAVAVVAVVSGYPIVYIMQWGWSDPLFVACSFAGLSAVERLVERRRDTRLFVVAATACAVGALTRYAGVFFIIATVLVLLWRGIPRLRAAAFAAVTLAPIALWIAINSATHGSAVGDRSKAGVGSSDAIAHVVDVVGKWITGPFPSVVRIAAVLLVVSAMVWSCVRAHARPQLTPTTAFLVIYTLLLTATAVITDINPPNDRLLSPLFAPLVMGAVRFVSSSDNRLLRALFGGWLAASTVSTVVFSIHRATNGLG